MAELTFKSPGVSTREIDLSGPTQSGPSGIPAGVIGTAKQGRAFVPITVANFADFIAEFGDVETDLFAPMAMRQWLSYASAGTFIRTLGVGDGKKRDSNGAVTRAGFTVGSQTVQANGGHKALMPPLENMKYPLTLVGTYGSDPLSHALITPLICHLSGAGSGTLAVERLGIWPFT